MVDINNISQCGIKIARRQGMIWQQLRKSAKGEIDGVLEAAAGHHTDIAEGIITDFLFIFLCSRSAVT